MLDLSYKKLSFATYKALSQGIFPHIRLSSVEMRNKDVLLLISAKKQTRQWHQAFLASFGLLHKQSLSLSTTRSQGNVLSGCSSSCIRTLILENNHISAKSIQALRTLSALTILDLSNNSLSFREIKALASVLKDAPITHLNLSHNCIKDKGTIALAEAFKERTSIAELSLSHNNITDIGAIALAHTLKAETTITTLNLNVNWIGVEGATAIADALKKMTSTVTLNLSYNPIEGAGQSVLDDLKRSRPSLTIYY